MRLIAGYKSIYSHKMLHTKHIHSNSFEHMATQHTYTCKPNTTYYNRAYNTPLLDYPLLPSIITNLFFFSLLNRPGRLGGGPSTAPGEAAPEPRLPRAGPAPSETRETTVLRLSDCSAARTQRDRHGKMHPTRFWGRAEGKVREDREKEGERGRRGGKRGGKSFLWCELMQTLLLLNLVIIRCEFSLVIGVLELGINGCLVQISRAFANTQEDKVPAPQSLIFILALTHSLPRAHEESKLMHVYI